MNLRLAVAAGFAGLTLLSGCATPTVSASTGPTATAAPRAGSSLSPADFAAAAKRPGTVVLDVRTPAEFAAGHLPGAINIDVEAPDFAARVAALDPAVPYAVYCRSANRSKSALSVLAQAGFADRYDLAGGITAWRAAGGEVVTG